MRGQGTLVGFFKKANHYDNFDCYTCTLGNEKLVVGTSENASEPDYDVIKMATILNYQECSDYAPVEQEQIYSSPYGIIFI